MVTAREYQLNFIRKLTKNIKTNPTGSHQK